MPPLASTARPRRAQAERSASTQAQLLDAAAHLIHTRSFQGASMFEVAKAAGVTPGALQHHFGSKAELMIRLLERSLTEGLDDGPALPPPEAPLTVRVQGLLEGLWQATYAQPRFLVAWGIYFGSVGDSTVIGRVAEVRTRVRAVLHQRFLQVLPELGERPAPAAMVDLVLSSLRGIAVGRLFGASDAADAAHAAQLAALASLLTLHCSSLAADAPLR